MLIFILYIILSSAGLILFKLGSTSNGFILHIFNTSFSLSIKTILGIICYGCSFLLWLYIVNKNNLSIIMPLSVAFVNTFVVLGSIIFLKEQLTLQQIIGIIIVIFGVTLMKWGN